MSNAGTLLLSKVLDDNDVQALALHNVSANHFKVEADRKAYEFIREYAAINGGQAPSYATVMDAVPGFYYLEQVNDSYAWLTRQLLNDAAKVEVVRFLEQDIQTIFDEHKNNMPEMIDKFKESLDNIKYRTDVREKVGVSLKSGSETFLAEYDRRKSGESFKMWKSAFSHIGEYVSGNMYVVYGKSGRGKSVIATVVEALEMALQGATVLIWSMEMPWYEVMVRLYTQLSGRKGLTVVPFDGVDYEAGFDSSAIRKGTLAPEFEVAFRAFVDNINSEIPGEIIIRGVDDEGFYDRSLRALEADILQTNADVVIVDPFYYLDYEQNVDRTTAGAASETSKKLRRMTGIRKVVTIAITQAEEEKTVRNDEGEREVKLPERENVTKTKQLLQDAAILIAVDTDYKQGRGLVGLNKGRDGGEGDVVEIMYLPQYGIVREMETGAASVDQFAF